jgi:hypothetical protein
MLSMREGQLKNGVAVYLNLTDLGKCDRTPKYCPRISVGVRFLFLYLNLPNINF